jgi:hypothetical protein
MMATHNALRILVRSSGGNSVHFAMIVDNEGLWSQEAKIQKIFWDLRRATADCANAIASTSRFIFGLSIFQHFSMFSKSLLLPKDHPTRTPAPN